MMQAAYKAGDRATFDKLLVPEFDRVMAILEAGMFSKDLALEPGEEPGPDEVPYGLMTRRLRYPEWTDD